jgi:hypothetical protein
MCLTQRAAAAGLLARAIDITLDTAARTTQQMRSMQGQLRADLREPKRKRSWS